jgi:hypothetical protein
MGHDQFDDSFIFIAIFTAKLNPDVSTAMARDLMLRLADSREGVVQRCSALQPISVLSLAIFKIHPGHRHASGTVADAFAASVC